MIKNIILLVLLVLTSCGYEKVDRELNNLPKYTILIPGTTNRYEHVDNYELYNTRLIFNFNGKAIRTSNFLMIEE